MQRTFDKAPRRFFWRNGPTGVNVNGPIPGDFEISPAYLGRSVWDLTIDGPLDIGTYGEYTITPLRDISVGTKLWGAGGARGYQYDGVLGSQGPGGGGGFSAATIALKAGVSYIIQVGQGGARSASTSPTNATYLAGGQASTLGGTQGGGYTGIFKTYITQVGALVVAGGGGGGGDSRYAGNGDCAGGGISGATSRVFNGADSQWGGAGTQSAGGGASFYNSATAGSALQGGKSATVAGAGAGLGGGGGGYFGGGGGNVGSGGGGSGYVKADPDVTGYTTTGYLQNPANPTDADRGGAGLGGSVSNTGSDGRVIITPATPQTGDTAQHWRIYVTGNQDGTNNGQFALAEFILNGTSGRIFGGTPSANSLSSNAVRAFDGDMATVYTSAGVVSSYPRWLQYSFATPKTVIGVGLTIRGNDPVSWLPPKDFVIQKSDDGVNWTTVIAPAAQVGWHPSETRFWNLP